MDIQSGDYADAHFSQKLWDAGEHGLTLSLFNGIPKAESCYMDRMFAIIVVLLPVKKDFS